MLNYGQKGAYIIQHQRNLYIFYKLSASLENVYQNKMLELWFPLLPDWTQLQLSEENQEQLILICYFLHHVTSSTSHRKQTSHLHVTKNTSQENQHLHQWTAKFSRIIHVKYNAADRQTSRFSILKPEMTTLLLHIPCPSVLRYWRVVFLD